MPSFTNCPDDEALATAHIAAGIDLVHAGGIAVSIGGHISAAIQFDTCLIEQASLMWPNKAHGQEDQIGLDRKLAALNLLEATILPFDMDTFEAGNILAKQLTFLANADAAGVVVGARVPVILTSRADTVRTRRASAIVAALYAQSLIVAH